MSRDKQIDEMGTIIATKAFERAHEIDGDENLADIVATELYEKGYRKASDLAEEIFAEIEKILNRIYNTYVFEDNDYSDDDVAIECAVNYGTEVAINIAELKKKYTKEITEDN